MKNFMRPLNITWYSQHIFLSTDLLVQGQHQLTLPPVYWRELIFREIWSKYVRSKYFSTHNFKL